MSLATSNRDGGRTNEAGHLRGVTKGFAGQVLSGLAVSQRGAGANMSVDVAIGDAIIQRSDGTYGHPAWNDAVYNQVIAAADGSNPRRDIIVMYIDYGQTPSTGVANNTNGVVKIKSVSGTAAGSPVDPSTATIQSSVGSGNPFVRLARVRVAAGATSISNSVIDDLRVMATGEIQGGWRFDDNGAWVYASSTTFTLAGVDARTKFPVGTKIRLYQGGVAKYFLVTAVAFSTNTTVTLWGGGVYSLANSSIDKPSYSYDASPSDYPATMPTSTDGIYTSAEIDTGKRWINGKPIYRQVFSGTITAAAGTRPTATLGSGIERIINYEGYYSEATLDIVMGSTRIEVSGAASGYNMVLLNAGSVFFATVMNSARTNAPYVLVVEYTKV